uniref:Secreted protein n=1 Tax=Setaria viridis TaxID=4556 RepID=A0A4U6SY70_SETVI|nr:hypothetical protein SEVIR_9G162750v2 [Setaria viridis]
MVVFFFPSLGLGLPVAAAPPPSRPCHALFAFFPPPPSSLPVSSPFYSVGSCLSGRPAVLVQEGQKEGIFAEFVGSELVQELGVWPLPDWGHKVGVVPRPQ